MSTPDERDELLGKFTMAGCEFGQELEQAAHGGWP